MSRLEPHRILARYTVDMSSFFDGYRVVTVGPLTGFQQAIKKDSYSACKV